MGPLLLLTSAIILMTFVALSQLPERPRRLDRRPPPERLGLVARSPTRWEGQAQGVDVVVLEPHHQWVILAVVPFAMPKGTHLGPSTSRRDDRLLWSAVEPLVEAAVAQDLDVALGQTVRIGAPLQDSGSREVEQGLAHAIGLVRALTEAHWRLTERPRSGLREVTIGPSGEVRGDLDGMPVRILGPHVGERFWSLQVRADLGTPLPADTLVRAGRGRSLGDMILDQALDARSSDLRALAAILARDEVRGPVLEVLAAHPGSELRSDEVVHVVDDGALDVGAALDRVRDLVRAIAR